MKTSSSQPFGFKKVTHQLRALALCLFCTIAAIPSWASFASGNFHINSTVPVAGNIYRDIASAISDLEFGTRSDGGTPNGPGVRAPVVFRIDNGTYTESMHITAISGASATNTITFQSNGYRNTDVVISQSCSSSSTDDYIVHLEKASFINFRYITFQRLGGVAYPTPYYSRVFWIEGGQNNTISNCTMRSDTQSFAMSHLIDMYSVSGSLASNFSMDLDTICGSAYLNWNATHLGATNTSVTNCKFSTKYACCFMDTTNGVTFDNDYFGANADEGIVLNNCVINKITNSRMYGRGLLLQYCVNPSSSPTLIANNIIHISRGPYPIETIRDIQGAYHHYYFNTIYANTYTQGVDIEDTAGTHNFVNNILIDTGSYIEPIRIRRGNGKVDYNCYLTGTKFGMYNTTPYSTLAAWQSGTGLDSRSISQNPNFYSDSMPRPLNTALNMGLPLADVPLDIYGHSRNSLNPTLGAVEGTQYDYFQDTTYCKGTCATLTAPIPGTAFSWSTGGTSNSIYYCPTGQATVSVAIWNGTDTIKASRTVYVTSTACVWPGDANNDFHCKIGDVLYIGLAYGDTGHYRPVADNGWYGQPCLDWTTSFGSGVNHKHADCDGNGKVGASDLLVIAANHGKSHTKTEHAAAGNPNDPPLTVSFSVDSAAAGDTVVATLNMGSSTIKASDVYGVAMEVSFSGYKTAPSKVTGDFSNSWLGTINKDMLSLVYVDTVAQTINVGLTRIDHANMSGYGKIGALSIVMPEDLAGKREVKQVVHLEISNYQSISSNESNIPLNPIGDSISVYEYKSGIAPSASPMNTLLVYPNPANNLIHIIAPAEMAIQSVAILDIMGKTVLAQHLSAASNRDIDISTLPKGMYFMEMVTHNGISKARFTKE